MKRALNICNAESPSLVSSWKAQTLKMCILKKQKTAGENLKFFSRNALELQTSYKGALLMVNCQTANLSLPRLQTHPRQRRVILKPHLGERLLSMTKAHLSLNSKTALALSDSEKQLLRLRSANARAALMDIALR